MAKIKAIVGTKGFLLVAVTALALCAASLPLWAGTGGEGSGSTQTINVDVGTFSLGTLAEGHISVSGGENGTVRYTWGQLRASSPLLGQIRGNHDGLVSAALGRFQGAVGSLPSNLELLTASVPASPAFLYYESNPGGTAFELPTNITSGADAYGIEAKTIGGRTASWSQSTSSSTESYAVNATNTQVEQVTVGGRVVGTFTTITNYAGTGQLTFVSVVASKYVSPLVLDMTGRGKLEASDGNWLPHPGRIYNQKMLRLFDINGNGFESLMEWAGPNDGILVDPKADGTVDGTCLFGTTGGYSDGFEKLSLRDANNDLKIAGAELAGLAVWQDKNSNAMADSGEVTPVEQLGITEISLRANDYAGTFVRNGKTYRMWDWWPSGFEVKRVKAEEILAR